jgi:diguanylate cyclase (GGDEF)-like protein
MLKIKGTFLDSKVARRLFLLFIISALVPIIILAFFSLRQINLLTTQNVEQDLRQGAKSYGLSVYERLTLLDQKLSIHADALEQSSSGSDTDNKSDVFSRLLVINLTDNYVLDLTDNTYQSSTAFPLISDAEHAFLLEGNPVVLTQYQPDLPAKIYLLRAIKNSTRIIAGLIEGEALWGGVDTFDESKGFCVYGTENKLLYCSQMQLDAQLQTIKAGWEEQATGNIQWTDGDHSLLVGFWNLFLKPKFLYPSFTIAITYDQDTALESISRLRNIFIIISLFALVIIAFLSTIQIRRYLIPLEELMKGIKRISNNDFDHPVTVSTDDEFNQLANSFNSMSTRISQQFKFLTTLSEIDQLILSHITLKDILATTISHGNNAVQSETINIAMIDEKNNELLDLYSEDMHHVHGMAMSSYPILASEKNALIHKKTTVYEINDRDIPNYLKPLIQKELSCFALVPVVINDKLTAILIFGFSTSDFSEETHSRLRELGDRFAIALEKSAWENQLYIQAHYDPLTQLPNRQLLNDRLQQAIKRATRDKSSFPIMFLDLDRFKTVNDSLGHTSGDKLLKIVSQRITDTLREEDTVARLGGDEFIIYLATTEHQHEIYSHASQIALKIMATITQPFTIDNQDVHISGSIGIATFPNDGEDVDTLLKNADSAMYHAKSEGRNNFQFYSKELNEKAMQTLVMETNLHQALENNEFELYYQPKVETQTGKILGAEALIRWIHPTQGMIRPDQFIPVAEDTGLITQIGEWTLHEACHQNKAWQDKGLSKIKVGINLSPRQFQHQNLIEIVGQTLANSELSPVYLDLEIIEGTAMHDIEQTIVSLQQLKKLGLSISIDDYGTGYSTLSYLKQFPVDTLKIDMSFIRNLVESSGDRAIVSSTIILAHNLGLTVVAEGVEDAQQLELLQNLDCDEIQGYYFSRPLPADEFSKLLEKGVITPSE